MRRLAAALAHCSDLQSKDAKSLVMEVQIRGMDLRFKGVRVLGMERERERFICMQTSNEE